MPDPRACVWALVGPRVFPLPLHRQVASLGGSRQNLPFGLGSALAPGRPQGVAERMRVSPYLGSSSKGGGKPGFPMWALSAPWLVAGPSDRSIPFMYLGSDGAAGLLAAGQ